MSKKNLDTTILQSLSRMLDGDDDDKQVSKVSNKVTCVCVSGMASILFPADPQVIFVYRQQTNRFWSQMSALHFHCVVLADWMLPGVLALVFAVVMWAWLNAMWIFPLEPAC